MGAGVSGSGPGYHDSTVTLSCLVPDRAYRDAFYRALKALAGASWRATPRGGRETPAALRGRAAVPEPGHRHPACRAPSRPPSRLQFYAAMGYPTAARQQAENLRAATIRHRNPDSPDGGRVRGRPERTGRQQLRRSWPRSRTSFAAASTARRSSTRGTFWDTRACSRSSPGEDTVRDPRAED